MAGKGNRDYVIHVYTDDPRMFDWMPTAAGGWEARMRNKTTGDVFVKYFVPDRQSPLSDPGNAGGQVVEELQPGEALPGSAEALDGYPA